MNHADSYKRGILITGRSSLWFISGLFHVNKTASQLTPRQERGCNWSDECSAGSTMLHINPWWWEVVGGGNRPTNQRTLINNQHILLIMDEYHLVASLTAVQFRCGKESVLTKGEGNIQRNLLTLKAAFSALLFFLVIYYLSLCDHFQTNTLDRKKSIAAKELYWRSKSSLQKFWPDLFFFFLPQIQ